MSLTTLERLPQRTPPVQDQLHLALQPVPGEEQVMLWLSDGRAADLCAAWIECGPGGMLAAGDHPHALLLRSPLELAMRAPRRMRGDDEGTSVDWRASVDGSALLLTNDTELATWVAAHRLAEFLAEAHAPAMSVEQLRAVVGTPAEDGRVTVSLSMGLHTAELRVERRDAIGRASETWIGSPRAGWRSNWAW
ncbi:MAG: hypothetical protein EP330_05555 [Deltaproteobacteria bacterium]|nr:MAG: hypothetical protein EP330_05555 [Deltaproteobacteria bacterium]